MGKGYLVTYVCNGHSAYKEDGMWSLMRQKWVEMTSMVHKGSYKCIF